MKTLEHTPDLAHQASPTSHQEHDERMQQYMSDHAQQSAKAQELAGQAETASEAADVVFGYYKGQGSRILKDKLADTMEDVEDLIGQYQSVLRRERPKDDEYEHKRTKLFESFGFDEKQANELVRAWGATTGSRPKDINSEEDKEWLDRYTDIVRSHLREIARIEGEMPGAAAGLFKQYGIRNFGRYWHKQLIDQYRGRHSGPVEVLMAAAEDPSGTGFSPRSKAYGALTSEAREVGMENPIYVEARDPLEAFNHLATVRDNFGGEIQKIDVVAHGGKKSLQLSRGQRLSQEEIAREKHFTKLIEDGVLAPDADVILSACYSQKVAQEISKQTKGQAVAPGATTRGIYIEHETGEFEHWGRGKVHVYEAGKRVNVSRARKLGRRALQAATRFRQAT